MSEYTERMENKLFEEWNEYDEYNDDYSELIKVINREDLFRTFGDGLFYFMQKKNPQLTAENVIKYLEQCCSENGVEIKEIASTNTLKNWFKGGPRPKKGENSRKSIFALAFALKLSPEETSEVFHKVYLDRAFDYRNENDIIYYFCLRNNKTWEEAENLIKSINYEETEKSDATVYTSKLKEDLDAIKDEVSLITYIKKHRNNLSKKNVSAKKIMKQLLDKAKENAVNEASLPEYDDLFVGSDRTSINFTYEVITGCSVSGEKGTKTLFKNARLPKEIKNRFPEAITLSKENTTFEELRKIIILLFSYNYWFLFQYGNQEIEIDDYIEEINVYLNESGFPLMYYGNPYDWMFLYCTLASRPLDVFRGLLSEVLSED